ncbi:MAG: hypothetical protein ACPG5C_04865, partial [Alphaproteobacteria bacterium]
PWPEFWPIVLGLLFVLVTLLMPRGLMGLWHSMFALIWRRLLRGWVVADADPTTPGSGAAGSVGQPDTAAKAQHVVASA